MDPVKPYEEVYRLITFFVEIDIPEDVSLLVYSYNLDC